MNTTLRHQWNQACLQAGIKSISPQKAAKICAVLMLYGNNEAMVLNQHFQADILYIKQEYHVDGGCVPDATFARYLKEYVADLEEADRQGLHPSSVCLQRRADSVPPAT